MLKLFIRLNSYYVLINFLLCICSFFLNVRLVLEFDLLVFAFGKLGTVTMAWFVMFTYTLFVPYCALVLWGSWYHRVSSKLGLTLSLGLVLSVAQLYVLGHFPVNVVVHNQLPPASRFIVILEQVSVFFLIIHILSFSSLKVRFWNEMAVFCSSWRHRREQVWL